MPITSGSSFIDLPLSRPRLASVNPFTPTLCSPLESGTTRAPIKALAMRHTFRPDRHAATVIFFWRGVPEMQKPRCPVKEAGRL